MNLATLTLEKRINRSHIDVRREPQKLTRENNEPLVSRRSLEQVGIVCRPFWDEMNDFEGVTYTAYRADHPDFDLCVRENVAERLVSAAGMLPANWQLVLKAGYRPMSVQLATLKNLVAKANHEHPGWSDDRCLRHAQTYVTDPRIYPPPHVTGGAVDVDVYSKASNRPIDFGCPPNTDSEIAHLHSSNISPQQSKNRITLLTAMLRADFAPLTNEWWHYQYGEQVWAQFYGHDATLYNVLEV